MTLPTDVAQPPGRVPTAARSPSSRTVPAMDSALARQVLLQALLLGAAADTLIYGLQAGVGFPLFVALLSLGATSLVWRAGRAMPREGSAWLSTAVLFAAARAWRDAETLQALDLLATAAALGMAGVALSDPASGLLASRLRETVHAARGVARTILAGVFPLAIQELFAPPSGPGLAQRTRPALRAALIAASLLIPFGFLLREADPIFASLLMLPEMDGWQIFTHGLLFGAVAWLVGGWARAALMPELSRRRAPDAMPFSLGMLDVTTALATLNVLFALFVATQLGWFFGGERFLHERTGLTAAQYARGGFFQMVLVVLLVVPVLVATRAALQPGGALARRHTALALPIIALLGAMILSAMLRMRLYVQYFGLTTDRFYPIVFMGWLALVLVWLALTVLRGRGRTFLAGAVVSGAAMLVGLHVVSADVIVARANIARAASAPRGSGIVLDRSHLAGLSGEASELATAAALAPLPELGDAPTRYHAAEDRCIAVKRLLDRWGSDSPAARQREQHSAWRFWNAGEARAIQVVKSNAAALRSARRASCARNGASSSATAGAVAPTAH